MVPKGGGSSGAPRHGAEAFEPSLPRPDARAVDHYGDGEQQQGRGSGYQGVLLVVVVVVLETVVAAEMLSIILWLPPPFHAVAIVSGCDAGDTAEVDRVVRGGKLPLLRCRERLDGIGNVTAYILDRWTCVFVAEAMIYQQSTC